MIANLKWAFHAASYFFALFSLCSYSTITLSNMPHCQTPPPHVYQIIMPPASKEKVIEIIRQKFNCNLDPVIRYFTNFASLFPNEPFPSRLKLILLSCNKNENATSLCPISPFPITAKILWSYLRQMSPTPLAPCLDQALSQPLFSFYSIVFSHLRYQFTSVDKWISSLSRSDLYSEFYAFKNQSFALHYLLASS